MNKLSILKDKYDDSSLRRIQYRSIVQLDDILRDLEDKNIDKFRGLLESYVDYCLNFYHGDAKSLHENQIRYYSPIIFHLCVNHGFERDGWSVVYVVPGLVIDVILAISGLSESYFYLPLTTLLLYTIGFLKIRRKRRKGKYLISDM